MSVLDLFCHVDDFCRQFVPDWLQLQLTSGAIQHQRSTQLRSSENHDDSDWVSLFYYRTSRAYSTTDQPRCAHARRAVLEAHCCATHFA